jgi:hypothetical protein
VSEASSTLPCRPPRRVLTTAPSRTYNELALCRGRCSWVAVFAMFGCLSAYSVWVMFNKYRAEGIDDSDSDSDDDDDDGGGAAAAAQAAAAKTAAGKARSKSGGKVKDALQQRVLDGSPASATPRGRRAKRS